jgi:hypothetical protein
MWGLLTSRIARGPPLRQICAATSERVTGCPPSPAVNMTQHYKPSSSRSHARLYPAHSRHSGPPHDHPVGGSSLNANSTSPYGTWRRPGEPGVLVFGLAHGALGLAPRSKAGAGNRTATPACRELPYPAPPSLAYAARLGRQARGRARGASIAVHGMMTPVRTNGDAPASAGANGCAIRRRTTRESAVDCPKKSGRRR